MNGEALTSSILCQEPPEKHSHTCRIHDPQPSSSKLSRDLALSDATTYPETPDSFGMTGIMACLRATCRCEATWPFQSSRGRGMCLAACFLVTLRPACLLPVTNAWWKVSPPRRPWRLTMPD